MPMAMGMMAAPAAAPAEAAKEEPKEEKTIFNLVRLKPRVADNSLPGSMMQCSELLSQLFVPDSRSAYALSTS